MKSGLPDLHPMTVELMNLMRATAFDKLHGLFQRRRVSPGEKHVDVIWHQDKLMQEVGASVTISEQASHNDFRHFPNTEERAVLPGFRRHEVGT